VDERTGGPAGLLGDPPHGDRLEALARRKPPDGGREVGPALLVIYDLWHVRLDLIPNV
jgi:hypothetical protein